MDDSQAAPQAEVGPTTTLTPTHIPNTAPLKIHTALRSTTHTTPCHVTPRSRLTSHASTHAPPHTPQPTPDRLDQEHAYGRAHDVAKEGLQ